ncbi:hypothetical protein C5B72_17370 [Acinetobacter sp. KU 011TH]|uniref:hypothetical protein n=1 Tax=Acinetobacter pittii TaxID=48296 RepID=UPI00083DAA56|nr:hypothetical protein [Acinetobacter pittii]MCG6037264.1 hypothetical protein [Acinetobacter baumannii]TDM60861.1 hypothetical protein C5B72_17370 [Acinetobacter sp. KU 011TH]TDM61039.1 hypothetical protein C4608_17380 [Acinetobacter sp. KU 013TH]MCK0914097.1 hypothetical protein [Acinetobacter pittii]MDE4040557.1 hypothetical protein [Acinetobacter pittii]
MSELSKDKTKRRLTSVMKDYQWRYQYSLFPRIEGFDKNEDKERAEDLILSELNIFRDKLRKRFLDIGILLVIKKRTLSEGFRVNYRKDFQQIYLTWYSSEEIPKDKLKKIIDSVYGDEVNLLTKQMTVEKIEKSISSIKEQRLHDLTKYFDYAGKRFDRFSCLNLSKFVELN